MKKSIIAFIAVMLLSFTMKSQFVGYILTSQDLNSEYLGWNYFDSINVAVPYIPSLRVTKLDCTEVYTRRFKLKGDSIWVNNKWFTSSDFNKGITAFSWGNHASAGYLTSVPAQSFSSLTGKPTTISGYGITDAYTKTQADGRYLQAEVDGSTINEIQTLSISTNTLTLSNGGGSVTLPSSPGSNNASAYGTGTAYTLTTTYQKISFGTTSPSITLPAAGTYLIMANLKIEYVGLTTLATSTCNFKLRRTNNTASDLSNANTAFNVPVVTLLTQTGGDADMQSVIYTTTNSNDVIEMWGQRGNSVSVGSMQVGEASIIAIRLY